MRHLVVRYNRLVVKTGAPSGSCSPASATRRPAAPSCLGTRVRHAVLAGNVAGPRRRSGAGPSDHAHQLMAAVAESITTTGAWEWRATGTTWRIHHTGGVEPAWPRTIAQAVERDEARWSRFRSDSEVARVNARPAAPCTVSPATLDLLEACVYWIRAPAACSSRSSAAHWSPGATAAASSTAPRTPRTSPIRAVSRTAADRVGRGRRGSPPARGSTWAASPRAGWPVGGGLLRGRCDDPAVLVDAGGDLVAARGDTSSRWRTLGAPEPRPSPTSGSRPGQGVATSGFGRRRWQNGDGRPRTT